ncbi:MAG: radical SAM protein [Candidatus Omnitrophica bacterium]|nr:radical SAM protein [Candidatus Omnitrophota bacterium]
MSEKIDLLLIKTHQVKLTWVPLGLLYVAQGALNAGAKVKILDLSLERDYQRALKTTLKEYAPSLVGAGGMFEEFEGAKEIASVVKAICPKSTMIMGGPFAASLTEEFLADANVDIVALKEGESTIQDLVRFSRSQIPLADIKGIAYRKAGQVVHTPARALEDVNAIASPAWKLIDVERYIESKDNSFGISNLRVVSMSTSRGCPYACIYCDKNIFGRIWRGRDPKNIVDEMIFLRDTYGINAVMFIDDIFDVNKKWVESVLDEIRARNVKMYWWCNSRVNHADYELYRKMQEAGCRYIGLGIEFGSTEMLTLVNKRATVEQAHKAVEIAHSAGLKVVGYYMLGMLNETKEQICETIRFAMDSKIDSAGVSLVTPIKKTALYDLALKSGKVKPQDHWWKTTRANAYLNLTDGVTHKELAYLHARAYWMLFWTRPSRKFPRWFCKIMQHSFYVFGPLAGDRFISFIYWLDGIRRKLRLGLP